MNDEELRQLLAWQLPETQTYNNYQPSQVLQQGLLDNSIQQQNNQQALQQLQQSAQQLAQNMAQNAAADQSAAMSAGANQMADMQAASQQALAQQQQQDAQRRNNILKLGMQFLPGGLFGKGGAFGRKKKN